MAYLQEQMETLKFDKRLLEANLKNGIITKDQYDQFINQLKDVENQSEKINLNEPSKDDSVLEPNGSDPQSL